MTPPLTERIALVLAECERIIAASEKATAGPWKASFDESVNVRETDGARVATMTWLKLYEARRHGNEVEQSAKFIAASRTFCPAAAVGIKTSIEWFQDIGEKYGVIADEEAHSALCDLTSPFAYLWE